MDEKQNNELRWKTHSYKLSNQSVIELAYCVKDLWDLAGDGKPGFEQANCRNAVRELIGRGMLPEVDDEYRRLHADVVSFCLGNTQDKTAKQAFAGDLEKSIRGTFQGDEMPPKRKIDLSWSDAPEAIQEFYKQQVKAPAPPDCLQTGLQDECGKYHDCPHWAECVGAYIDRLAAGWTWNP